MPEALFFYTSALLKAQPEKEAERLKLKLKTARVNAGLTIDDVARALKKSKNTIISYEKYKTITTIDTAKALADLYGLPFDDIIFLPDDCA